MLGKLSVDVFAGFVVFLAGDTTDALPFEQTKEVPGGARALMNNFLMILFLMFTYNFYCICGASMASSFLKVSSLKAPGQATSHELIRSKMRCGIPVPVTLQIGFILRTDRADTSVYHQCTVGYQLANRYSRWQSLFFPLAVSCQFQSARTIPAPRTKRTVPGDDAARKPKLHRKSYSCIG